MAQKKKSFIKKLGLTEVETLTPKICRERVRTLKKGIKAGEFEGKLLEQAKYYANWYKWRASNKPKKELKKRAS